MNCVICKNPLDPVLENVGTHPSCFPFDELDEGDAFANMMKSLLIDVIMWAQADVMNPRGKQVAVGPSDLGTPCDRRVGYRLAGVDKVNTEFDPWPMIMGTAVHSWLETSFQAWNKWKTPDTWLTETTLHFQDFVEGHADLYNAEHQTVIDWKGAGPDVMRKVRKEVPVGYRIQVQIYGYLFMLAGLPVKKVCLAFLPRAGWLKDMYLWCEDFDEDVAKAAISRMYGIAQQIVDMDILTHSHRWEQIPAQPSNDCGWCPYYDPGRDAERGADATGCPGR
ncbi:MAG TPA: hypothetical protein VK899_06260 [Gemmatimonadales bacterium]|nr:hypothetical protein [Gemmatimonadales bacterium]